MKTIWTVWADYGATGEGHTLMVWIGYAVDAAEAQYSFVEKFGELFAKFCRAEQGAVINEVTAVLLPAETAKRLERARGRANLEFYSSLHINAS
ncbi:hypothetical protein HHL21_20785 [Massilia sp. RP-1-19]|uniref:Uncharacterized protein n=1 Tax=Massilia polaris TaxID=2728846 RepID=A0A848HXI1_9BURK|nr:hypothetical protein [Massilia polaris]NML63478.1 hypothetical protein [Massilia polaris]